MPAGAFLYCVFNCYGAECCVAETLAGTLPRMQQEKRTRKPQVQVRPSNAPHSGLHRCGSDAPVAGQVYGRSVSWPKVLTLRAWTDDSMFQTHRKLKTRQIDPTA